eukprot:gene60600-82904_t
MSQYILRRLLIAIPSLLGISLILFVVLALVGESGSGKSVSALSILRLLPYPTASHPAVQFLFEGHVLLDMWTNEFSGFL